VTPLFFATLLPYAAVQLLVYWRLREVWRQRRAWRLGVLAFLLLVNAAPFAGRVLTAGGWPLGGIVSLIGRSWAAASMWLALVWGLAALWNLAVGRLARTARRAGRLLLTARAQAGAALAAVAFVFTWGWFEAEAVRLETVVVRTHRLPAGTPPIRVVQLSDLHLGIQMSRRRLAAILDRVREARPDLLLMTGDFVDSVGPGVSELAAMLAQLDAPLGKLAVTGNHDLRIGIPRSEHFHRAAGFSLLRGESVKVAQHLIVAGVDDWSGRRLAITAFTDEAPALPPADRAEFVILLKHQPLVNHDVLHRFDLQLSGHTHAGQVFPARWLVQPFYPYFAGRYELPGGATLYVNRGAGTFGPPVRFLAPPEVTLILLQP